MRKKKKKKKPDPVLGKVVPGVYDDDQRPPRDAVHVAIVAITAKTELQPGERYCDVGIVDPFLKRSVGPGQTFWLCLDPGTVTEMRHHWSHPAFLDDSNDPGSQVARDKSVAWLVDFAATKMGVDKTYEELIEDATEYTRTGYHVMTGTESCRDGDWDAFWKHFAIATGIETNEEWCPYDCSC